MTAQLTFPVTRLIALTSLPPLLPYALARDNSIDLKFAPRLLRSARQSLFSRRPAFVRPTVPRPKLGYLSRRAPAHRADQFWSDFNCEQTESSAHYRRVINHCDQRCRPIPWPDFIPRCHSTLEFVAAAYKYYIQTASSHSTIIISIARLVLVDRLFRLTVRDTETHFRPSLVPL